MTDLAGRVVGIWGLGKEGLSMARTAAAHGARRIIAVDDRATELAATEIPGMTAHFGPDAVHLLRDVDIVFVSPGVPWRHPLFEELRRGGPQVSSAADWYLSGHGKRTIGVTGTKGKSTTAAFVAHLLTSLGSSAVVAGNIGTPLSDLSGPDSDSEPGPWVVAELSSQQCALLRTSPAVAVITNLYQDHLDFHGDVPNYYAAKAHIFDHGARALITTPEVVAALDGIGISALPPVVRLVDPVTARAPRSGGVMSYPHNVANAALAADAAAEVLGRPVTDAEVDAAAATFTGLPHRLQTVRTTGATRWIDDTLATTGESVVAALRAMPAGEHVALIVGGMDRQLDYRQLDDYLCSGQRRVTLIQGPSNGALIGTRFARSHAEQTHRVASLEQAVRLAAGLPDIDVVLLSPGAASYDIYRNYEAKAAAFCGYIDTL
ncbi:Mur ligase family protein [Mycolicibacterium sp. 120266]|uniref:Mur ligase family protein n=1 Tax=Mycolicibacterium sp. 120266 TaxID=3090601 RepID=UPI00299E3EE3|nr:Mur ligase family protein [Mycolicibacterium sp. 120266]MDX1872656.1 Mur ligase family protein [Mycolicibacterium sp. 120266]